MLACFLGTSLSCLQMVMPDYKMQPAMSCTIILTTLCEYGFSAYCGHIISVLSYIGQLEPLGKDAIQFFKEQYWLHKLLRMIPGTFSYAALTKLPVVGLPRGPSIFLLLLPSRYRTKLRSIPAAFIEGNQILDHALSLNIPLSQVCTDNLATPFWDTPSFVASSDSAVAACSSIFPLVSSLPCLDRGFKEAFFAMRTPDPLPITTGCHS